MSEPKRDPHAQPAKDLFHSKSAEQVVTLVHSTRDGLSADEAQRRLKACGPNTLTSKEKNNPLLLFVKQFNSVLIYILFVAMIISYLFEHVIDAYVIGAVIFINACIGFVQEYRAQKAIESLKHALVATASVVRDGRLMEIPAEQLVPGDIVSLEAGMHVPADMRLISSSELATSEAALTGESVAVVKHTSPVAPATVLADRANMVWMGTTVARGAGEGVVVATGDRTTLGRVAERLGDIADPATHFKQKARVLAIQMAGIATVTASLVFIVGYFIHGIAFDEIFLFTIAALVSGIPEGLPAILSIVLAAGAYRMSKRHALVRTLQAAETLGVTTTIITDKTGTLTQNVMMVERVLFDGGREVRVSGVGWSPRGSFSEDGYEVDPREVPTLVKIAHVAGWGAHAQVTYKKGEDRYEVIGEPTEAALEVFKHKVEQGEGSYAWQTARIGELPFETELKFRSSLVRFTDAAGDERREWYVVGAPEAVIARCSTILHEGEAVSLSDRERTKLFERVEEHSCDAMRMIALAYGTVHDHADAPREELLHDLTLAGLVAMKDPVRAEVPEAIRKARGAGIRVIMATGDHKSTAYAIAREIGLVDASVEERDHHVRAGHELTDLSDEDFATVVRTVSVFARVDPETKYRIAKTLQADGQVVAMTGDGVNDALALKQADVGIAMGITGTDVARGSSDIVLTDDNFASIVSAVAEGRTVFTNTRQASTFLVSTNFAEQATILTTLSAGLPLPLLPTQILWLNLATAAPAGLPLAAEPSHRDILNEPPRSTRENILSWEGAPFIVLIVLIMSIGALFIFLTFLPNEEKARTGAFAFMAFTQVFNMFTMRSMRYSLFSIGVFSNRWTLWGALASMGAIAIPLYTPFLQQAFQFVPLSALELIAIIASASLVLWFGEAYKYFRYSVYGRRTKTTV